jgi:hypothetical protein
MATKTYYCGFDGLVRTFNHDTSVWSDVSLDPSLGAKALNDIMCFPNDPTNVITVGQRAGSGSTAFFSTNSGALWSASIGAGTASELFEVWVVDANTVYACGLSGQAGPILYRSINSGANFTEMPLPSNAPLAPATAVHFYTSLVGVLAIGKKVYITTDGCTTWTATNGDADLLVSGNPIGTDATTYPHAIGGVNIYPLASGNYRITVLTDKGVVQSVDATNSIYTTTLDYSTILPYPSLKGTHLTWYGSNYFWITDNWGGIWYSTTGGVTWGNALSNYGANSTYIYGTHFYAANALGTEFTGFVVTNTQNPLSGTFTGSFATKNVCDVTVTPNGLQPGTNLNGATEVLTAVWTEVELNKCVRLKECNGTKEVIIKDIPSGTGLLSDYAVGSSINITYLFGNSNSPCLEVTDYQVPVCWVIEEIIEDCTTVFPPGQICIEVTP